MTIEESWEIVNEEMHLQNSVLFKAVHDATWKISSKNQQKIDIEKALKYLHNTYELHIMPLFDEDFKQAMEE